MEKCWCGNEKLKVYSKDYFRCDQCHTLVTRHELNDTLEDVKDEEKDLYGENYWENVMVKMAGKSSMDELIDMYLSERAIYWLKFLLKYTKLGAKTVEIGCGLGQLQYLLQRIDYEQIAFELSPHICEFVENELKINVKCGTFASGDFQYDSILAFDLFEHLLNPKEFIEECAKSIQDDGILVLQTPCYDYELSYDKMKLYKPRFQNLLRDEQHVFLYSKESITLLLIEYGFEYVTFEPAFFGDDYDMFLFASKSPIRKNSEKEINEYLNSTVNGRLVKAMITLFDKNQELKKMYESADSDRKQRLENIQKLEALLKSSEEDRANRLSEIEELTVMLQEKIKSHEVNEERESTDELVRMYKESETDRAARGEQIQKLTEMVHNLEK